MDPRLNLRQARVALQQFWHFSNIHSDSQRLMRLHLARTHCGTLTFNRGEVVELLRSAVEREANQIAYAKGHRLSRPYLNRILNGKREASAPFLKALWLWTVYAKTDKAD